MVDEINSLGTRGGARPRAGQWDEGSSRRPIARSVSAWQRGLVGERGFSSSPVGWPKSVRFFLARGPAFH